MCPLPAGPALHPLQGGTQPEPLSGPPPSGAGAPSSHGPAAQRDRRRRQWLQERNFAEATTQHGFKRARWRGLPKQTIQDQLIATLQNLKILLRKGRLGYFALLGFLQQWLRQLIASPSNFRRSDQSFSPNHESSTYLFLTPKKPLSGNSPLMPDPCFPIGLGLWAEFESEWTIGAIAG